MLAELLGRHLALVHGCGVLVRLLGLLLQLLVRALQLLGEPLVFVGVLLALGSHLSHLLRGLGDGLTESFTLRLRLLKIGGEGCRVLRIHLHLCDKSYYFIFY